MANKKKTHLTKMSTNGQLVIPVKIRDAAGLKPGMTFLAGHEGGTITLIPMAPSETKDETAPVEDTNSSATESEF